MGSKRYCLGIDTSNYTTSVAIVDEAFNIIGDSRKILEVRPGERGLRQSQALFEHIGNLPGVLERLKIGEKKLSIHCVAFSQRPRPAEGSYMPVFKAGEAVAKSIAETLQVPCYGFSHQEGHVEAARLRSGYSGAGVFLSLHLSGGTTEVIQCREKEETAGYLTEIVGGTGDLALGQLIDRVGVSLGLQFPCGKQMDEIACRTLAPGMEKENQFCRIKVQTGVMNISGIETQIQRFIEKNREDPKLCEEIAPMLFFRVGQALMDLIVQSREKTGILPVVVAGGVASSQYIRKMLADVKGVYFGTEVLSSDNGVGTAVLGMKRDLKR